MFHNKMQVEELASLVKDNLSCKHLILSVEEALVDFLQSDTRHVRQLLNVIATVLST